MKLQQLRYVWEVAHHNLNVSLTAQSLYTSQPGISKQIRLLEEELGVEVFSRSGKHLTRVTPAGEKIIKIAGEILRKVDNIKNIAQEYSDERVGILTIATTSTQARYSLPSVVEKFIEKYPDVTLQLHQGTLSQIAQMVNEGRADLAIGPQMLEEYGDIFSLSCYESGLRIVTNKGHPLTRYPQLRMEELAAYPIVTYVDEVNSRTQFDSAFSKAGLEPRIVITAADADIIKTYVRLGLGVGVISDMAFNPIKDNDLVAMDAGHLFEKSVSKIGFRRGTYLRTYMYDFINMFEPSLTQEAVDSLYLGTPSIEPDKPKSLSA